MIRAASLALLLGLTGCAAAGGAGEAGGSEASIPLRLPDGGQVMLSGRVCRPDGAAGPARVVAIAHGSPALASDRPGLTLARCESEAVRWFTRRGYLVVLALRRGYGATGGPYAESSANCAAAAYEAAARESARDVLAMVAYGQSLPGARPDGTVVIGQSAGGWATLGVNAAKHPGIIALVSMAGGRGGHAQNRPNNNCRANNLVTAAGNLARGASTPMLWVYTANDTFFGPSLAQSLHEAYVQGGGQAELRALPGFGQDGHSLFFGRGGSRIWGPLIEAYLTERGAT